MSSHQVGRQRLAKEPLNALGQSRANLHLIQLLAR